MLNSGARVFARLFWSIIFGVCSLSNESDHDAYNNKDGERRQGKVVFVRPKPILRFQQPDYLRPKFVHPAFVGRR